MATKSYAKVIEQAGLNILVKGKIAELRTIAENQSLNKGEITFKAVMSLCQDGLLEIKIASNAPAWFLFEVNFNNNVGLFAFDLLGVDNSTTPKNHPTYANVELTKDTAPMYLAALYCTELREYNGVFDGKLLTEFTEEAVKSLNVQQAGVQTSRTITPWMVVNLDLPVIFLQNTPQAKYGYKNGVKVPASELAFDLIDVLNSVAKKNEFEYHLIDEERVYNIYEEERIANNQLVEGYIPTKDDKLFVTRIYNCIKQRGFAPSFFFYGPAGTGKSEKGKYFAKALGLPYTFVCCSAMTNESDLRGKPQNINSTGGLVKALKAMVKSLWKKDVDVDGADDDKIRYSLTELVLACKYGWVIEIQEPSLIVNAGTLGFLNCVLDNNRTLILPSGEEIKIHPNTVFVFTTNLNYEGCNLLNNALLSRINYCKRIDGLSIPDQVERVISVTGYEGPTDKVELLIKAIEEINSIIKENDLTQGACDLRSAIECVFDVKNNNCSWREAARYTIEDKAILEDGYQDAIKLKLDSYFGIM